MTDARLAYLAGLVDAEGCISIARFRPKSKSGKPRNYSYQAILTVGGTDPRMTQMLAEAFGGSVCHRQPCGKNRRPQTVWTVASRKAKEAIAALFPYLIGKRTQAALVLELAQRTVLGATSVSAEELRWRYCAYLYCSYLNRLHSKKGRAPKGEVVLPSRVSVPPPQHVEKTGLAYIAGLVDGDGCVSIVRKRSRHEGAIDFYSLMVRVGMVDRRPLDFMVTVVGAGLVGGVKPRNRGLPQFVLQYTARRAHQVLKRLYPYLQLKREQAKFALFLGVRVASSVGRKSGNTGRRLDSEELHVRHAAYIQVRRLNQRGLIQT